MPDVEFHGFRIISRNAFESYNSNTVGFSIEKERACLGDADGDGEVISIDVTQIQRNEALFDTGIEESVLMNGDVDGNGVLEITDATWIQRWLALMDVPYAIGEAI